MDKLYWTTNDGRVLDVDEMSDAHVRNAFKFLLRNLKKATEDRTETIKFEINGDIAQDHINRMIDIECDVSEIDLY